MVEVRLKTKVTVTVSGSDSLNCPTSLLSLHQLFICVFTECIHIIHYYQ